MNLLDSVKYFLTRTDNDLTEVPDGFCPNCWGRQEYAGSFYKAIRVEQIDTNNLDEKKGWIQAYAEQHLTGITLSGGNDGQQCSVCYELED